MRRYQKIWLEILKHPPGKRIRIQVHKLALMKRVRKAVWKEKDLCERKDIDGKLFKHKFRLACEIDEEGGVMVFFLIPKIDEESV